MTQRVIPQGSTIGVLGGGQLGRMFAITARRVGCRVHTLSPDEDPPTGQGADAEIRTTCDDPDAVMSFAGRVEAMTFKREDIRPGAFRRVRLHLYGKSEARPGRKMGHLTGLASTVDEARKTVLAARAALLDGRAERA